MRVVAALCVLAGCDQLFGIDHFDHDPAVDAAVDALAPTTIVAISAGGYNTCALLANGQVWCLGLANGGQLGIGQPPFNDTHVPVMTQAPSDVVAIDVADAGCCLVRATNEASCWGSNGIALGITSTGAAVLVPTPVNGPAGVVQIATGNLASCLRHGGTIACAGAGNVLGDGTTTNRASFSDIDSFHDAIDVTTGDAFGCALRADGSVTCWGSNNKGQLGNGLISGSPEPSAVIGPLGPYTHIAAGDEFACGITPDGHVECWGDNLYGQLGDLAQAAWPMATRIPDLAGVQAITAASATACALLDDGTVHCWGDNNAGVLGDGRAELMSNHPVPIASLHDVIQISSRTGGHACALTRRRELYCWGYNGFGQVGQDKAIQIVGSPLPVTLPPS